MTADGVGASIVTNVERVLLGKREQVRIVVAALLAGGHVLIEDAPGVGKTLLAKAVARSIGGTVGRVQGTADLLPADITGVTIFDQERRDWDFRPGPLFNHVLLVDEINRATPRAQSALLEAMAEGHTTVDGSQHDLPEPFLVLATQNPFGDAGTFPLIAGEYDRFAVSVSLGLPGRDVERELLRGNGGLGALDALEAVTDPSELARCQREVAAMHVASAVEEYVLDIAEATRIGGPSSAGDRGISPRATQALLAVAKGCAATMGRTYVTPDDVQTVASAVLAHRMQADATTGLSAASAAVAEMLTSVAVPSV
jgi:MoxR-like ATPase